ncbi:MAG: TonB family protein [Fibrobacteres bacterium]|nr:TonB family protein [Fibrobacterota bacterium]
MGINWNRFKVFRVFLPALFLFVSGCAVKNPNIVLNWYVIGNDSEVVREKLRQGAKVDGEKGDKVTPLMIAAWTGNMDIVKLLIASGADIHRSMPNGVSPIILAAGKNNVQVVEYLLSKGAKPDLAPANQLNAVQVCEMLEYQELGRLFAAHGYAVKPYAPGSARTTDEILSIIRINSIQFKIIYDQYLKEKPGFRGKVVLKIGVGPDGAVKQTKIVSSTTEYQAFEEALMAEISNWKFGRIIGKDNDVVTIPFTFDE